MDSTHAMNLSTDSNLGLRHTGRGRLAWLRRVELRLQLGRAGLGPIVRRTLDVLAAGAALVCLAPIFLVAAIAIKLTDRGPIFFRQERIGQHGRRFNMWKLRTMIIDAEALKTALAQSTAGAVDGVRFKIRRDPRITPVGRVLRKFSIDELPQLANVLVGDMTLVGPRPPVYREVERYGSRELRRLEVRPGLTCLWQVGGRSDLSFEKQVDLDIEYIDRVRPFDEIMIVARTIPAVLTGRGAY